MQAQQKNQRLMHFHEFLKESGEGQYLQIEELKQRAIMSNGQEAFVRDWTVGQIQVFDSWEFFGQCDKEFIVDHATARFVLYEHCWVIGQFIPSLCDKSLALLKYWGRNVCLTHNTWWGGKGVD